MLQPAQNMNFTHFTSLYVYRIPLVYVEPIAEQEAAGYIPWTTSN